MWKYITFNKSNFSAFYFANLWFCFTAYFLLGDRLKEVGAYVNNLIVKDFKYNSSPTTMYYWSMVFVYFISILLIMMFIMQPLNIYLPDAQVEMWETVVTCIAVIGFFFYSFHKVFVFGMPDGTPPQLVKLIMGNNAFFLESSRTVDSVSVLWGNISDTIWNFFPLGFMWYRAKTGGMQSKDKGKGHGGGGDH